MTGIAANVRLFQLMAIYTDSHRGQQVRLGLLQLGNFLVAGNTGHSRGKMLFMGEQFAVAFNPGN